MNIEDGNLKLKPALINMVQQSPFYGKALEDANAHLQHFLEIRGTFTIWVVTQDAVEKMASNQSWDEERTQTHTRMVHQLEEVDILTTKIDLLMKKLEKPGIDHLKMVDAWVTCEECKEIGHMGINYLTAPQDVNFVGNSNNGFYANQGFNAGWNKYSFPFDNLQQGGIGQNFNRNEPSLRDIIIDQLRINDEVGKKIHATDKLLENINGKMDSFTVATQNPAELQ
jgi:hypothetical protein